MANFIEKSLPSKVRKQLEVLTLGALGLFLALQYNTVVADIFEKLFPLGEGIATKLVYLLLLTIVVVYVSVWIQKGLDGR
jgi:hypothetical protein